MSSKIGSKNKGKIVSLKLFLLLIFLTCASGLVLATNDAPAQGASAWKIATDRDQLSDRQGRLAVTMPKSSPLQNGKPVTAALIINCASAYTSGPTHPQLSVLFTPLKHMFMVNAVETRYRFDEGPIRNYKLAIPGRNDTYLVTLPKLKDEDPIADAVAAKRLRVEVYLPHTTNIFLDFNIAGAADAVKAIACQ